MSRVEVVKPEAVRHIDRQHLVPLRRFVAHDLPPAVADAIVDVVNECAEQQGDKRTLADFLKGLWLEGHLDVAGLVELKPAILSVLDLCEKRFSEDAAVLLEQEIEKLRTTGVEARKYAGE